MSLRARLAILYTSIVGGILLLFGVAVYAAVSLSLTNQIDRTLGATAKTTIHSVYLDENTGRITINSQIQNLSTDIYVQVWDRNNQSVFNWPLPQLSQPLDRLGLQSATTVYRDVALNSSGGSA